MKEKKSVVEFLSLTFGLSIIMYVLYITNGENAAADLVVLLLMWCPGIAALIVRRRYYRREKLLGLNKSKGFFLVLAIVIPIVYLGLSYGVYWIVQSTSFSGNLSLPVGTTEGTSSQGSFGTFLSGAITLIVIFVFSAFAAAGEEIGWRGFLLPQMTRMWSFRKAVIVSGLIWAIWHMPIMIGGVYNAGTPIWYQLPMFTLEILAFTVIISLLRLKSRSVWPAILIHTSHNYFDQVFFGPNTQGALKSYFVGETGILTILAVMLTALVVGAILKKKPETNPTVHQ